MFYCLLLLAWCVGGQSLVYGENIKVVVTPDHEDWKYITGDSVRFIVNISGDVAKEYSVSYEIGPERMTPIVKESFQSSHSNFVIRGGTMHSPGFLRCTVTVTIDEKSYSETATAAFEPEQIKPTVKCPRDFKKFWTETLREARKVPLDTHFTKIDEKCTDTYDVYQVDYLNMEYKNRSYGILTVPKKEGKFPAIIRFPGAGVHPLGGNTLMAGKDIITLDLYIHPFSMLWERSFYDNLKSSPYIDYKFWGVDDRESYYFKRVITGCVKAVDLIYELDKFDGQNLASWGSSQGGALSIITTSLDPRIKMLVVLCPAMCDHTGYLKGRAGGWPHFFAPENRSLYEKKEVIKTLSYYDVVNFARQISVPGFYSWGYNDETTPPTSFYSAYNVIKAPKQVYVIPEGKHRIYTEQTNKTYQWILDSFGSN